MAHADPLKDIELLIRSRYCIIHVDTAEEERAGGLVAHVADRLGLPLFVWTRTRGLRRTDKEGPVFNTAEPAHALRHVEAARFPAIYHFRGLGPFLQDPVVGGLLHDAAAPFAELDGAILMTGADVALPDAVGPMSARVALAAPSLAEYRRLLSRVLRDLHARMPVRIEMTPEDTTRLLNHIKGLTLMEAEKLLTRAIVEDGRLAPEDVRTVAEAKKEIVEREGLLEYYPVEETLADIAGLHGLKEWLARRRAIIAEPDKAAAYGLPFPKGMLLVGVPGCGKSLCAKAVAMEWGLPLLKLDPSNLYNKYIGESERNFKRAIETAERMAPVVLWIDEIEKAFAAAGDGDGGVSQRVLGTFLSWMQDRRRRRLRGRDGERREPAAARAPAQGPLRRDLLRGPARRRGAGGDLRDPPDAARPGAGAFRPPGAGPRDRGLQWRGGRAGRRLGPLHRLLRRHGALERDAARGGRAHPAALPDHGRADRGVARVGARAHGAGGVEAVRPAAHETTGSPGSGEPSEPAQEPP